DHPLAGTERILAAHREQQIGEILDEDTPDRKQVTLTGMISAVTRKITKNGAVWAVATLEDLSGTVDVLFFPKSYELLAPHIIEDTVVKVRGNVSRRDGKIEVFGLDLALLDISAVTNPNEERPVVLVTPIDRVNQRFTDELKRALLAHPGKAPVQLRLRKNGGANDMLLTLGPNFRVTDDPAFRSEMKMLLGAGGIE
ncbi:MAG TPA: OB-fold nucleic acid binding domain-containing protein, partial [Micromonosporaceae bacterium]|nr:OB-fold nucleic acid binding domain-containing protein [Micromonosporaceae bacterium]